MLAQKLALSLSTIKTYGAWSPDDESSLEAWYQSGVGIGLSGSTVRSWDDSSSNSVDMVQGDAAEMPIWTGTQLEFDGTGRNLQTGGTDITLSGAFTVGVRLNVGASLGTLLADNTIAGELLRFINTTTVRLKIDNTTAVDFSLDSGTWGDGYLLLSRDASDTITMYWNGTAQADTEELSGTSNIDAIGVRKTDLNPFDGLITEIQIFSTTNATLISNVNSRLSSL